jgi:hypothetical protein
VTHDTYIDGILIERRDDVARTVTTYGATGQVTETRPYTAQENAAAADVIHVRTIVVSLDRQTPRDHRMPRHVGCVLRHQLARRRNHGVAADRRHRLNPDSAPRGHVRATHRRMDHHQVT